MLHPNGRPMSPKLVEAVESNKHPTESQEELGQGNFVASDWRQAWWTYQSPPDNPALIDDTNGHAQYEVKEIDGILPLDLAGTLYRNGPGKFGVNGQRVAHVLDADGLVLKITIPVHNDQKQRTVTVQSRFIETIDFQNEKSNDQFMTRGTFGTGPMGSTVGAGLNEDPAAPSMWTKLVHRAFKVDIKNTANTQVIAFGGKVLALFEAGLPYRLDPVTLETIGEDDMAGTLPQGNKLAVRASSVPTLDFLGGAAHTAHPNICPRTGNLVGWSWTQLPQEGSLEVTIREWSPDDFSLIASCTYIIPDCDLAPHDMALTENYVVFLVNALEMNTLEFLSGLKGPAESLKMDGRKPVKAWILPRPTSCKVQEPRLVDNVPPCFSIHMSHAYENDDDDDTIVVYFSGWPPSDSTDFLGAWGGFCPLFHQIPPTFLWRLVLSSDDAPTLTTVCPTLCAEHPVVHPLMTQPKYSYAVVSNNVGDSSPPCGYARVQVDMMGESSEQYWFGSRYFCGEPLVVPKMGRVDEDGAYLLGMVQDSVRQLSFVAIFDLEQSLSLGPVCKIWLQSAVPHGLHGCFDPGSNARTSYFC